MANMYDPAKLKKLKLHYAVKEFREEMKGIYQRYDASMAIINRYKDSDRYATDKKVHDDKLRAEIKACKDKHAPNLYAAVETFEELVSKVQAVSPTSEQINLLQAIKLQKEPSANTIIMAARSLASCPIALNALYDIAKEAGVKESYEITREVYTFNDAKCVCRCIRSGVIELLTDLQRPNDKRRYMNIRTGYAHLDEGIKPHSGPSLMLRYDNDFGNEDECFKAFSDTDDASSKKFFDFILPKDKGDESTPNDAGDGIPPVAGE